jgi:hypothetical protein
MHVHPRSAYTLSIFRSPHRSSPENAGGGSGSLKIGGLAHHRETQLRRSNSDEARDNTTLFDSPPAKKGSGTPKDADPYPPQSCDCGPRW